MLATTLTQCLQTNNLLIEGSILSLRINHVNKLRSETYITLDTLYRQINWHYAKA